MAFTNPERNFPVRNENDTRIKPATSSVSASEANSNEAEANLTSPIQDELDTQSRIRIVLADDHTVLRDGLAHLLNTESDFEVVGVAGNGFDAIRLVKELQPDIVLMDLQMPHLSGVEAIRRLQEMHLSTNVIILTTFDTDEFIFEGIKAGAKGYLLKDVGREELCRTIRLVNQGQTLTQPAITARLFKLLAQDSPRKSEVSLTERELDVLKLLARGDRNKEIAGKLSISESTVKSYVTTIMQKFNVTDRTEAAMYAVQNRIIRLED